MLTLLNIQDFMSRALRGDTDVPPSVLQEFAERIVAQDQDAIDMIEDLVMRGRKKEINLLSDLDASSIYDTIEKESPLVDDD